MTPERFILDHPSGINISNVLEESSLPTSKKIERRDMKTGYVWYDLSPAEICGKFVTLSLCFHDGILDRLSIYSCNADNSTKSWGDWSESKERENAEDIKSWLSSLGYPTGIYDWGEIWADYDAKSASGHGGVRYSPMKPIKMA